MQVKADNNNSNVIMQFICDTKDGKYTSEKPDLTQITYARLDIQESNVTTVFDDCYDEVVLYGVSQ